MESRKNRLLPYVPRVVDSLVADRLKISGAVVLEGPRACGKTRTGGEHSASRFYLDTQATREMISLVPDVAFNAERPVLLDEWQLAPYLWNEVRHAVDSDPAPGQFILTGSSVPSDDVTRHTGAGRFLRIRMRTMTWSEKGKASGGVSLANLAETGAVQAHSASASYREVLDALLTSGFPAQTSYSPQEVRPLLAAYLNEISHTDVFRLADLRTQPTVIEQLIRSLARNNAAEVTFATLVKDVRPLAPTFSPETAARITGLLERLFVVEKVPAFGPKLRSKARLRTSPKYHLADPALAAVALGATESGLLTDPETAGFLFESAVVHDLAVYAEKLGARLWHYRDSNGYEIDAVLTFPDGGWAGVEIKLGGGQIEAGAASLLAASAQIDAGDPKFLAVITGTGFTANVGNGVVTFPLSALGS